MPRSPTKLSERLSVAASVFLTDVRDLIAVVTAREQQYDAFLRGRETNLLADGSGPLPTAEELGAELERFLAEQSRDGEQPPPGM